MGLHISVERIVSKTTEKTWHGTIPYYVTESVDWFDGARLAGDEDFIVALDYYWVDSDVPKGEEILARPSDFEKTRNWVMVNTPRENSGRLLEALAKMEADEKLCFSWSW